MSVVAVEISDREATHGWQIDRAAAPFPIRTLAPGLDLDQGTDVSPRMRALLDELRPLAIAVAGYDRAEMRGALRWGRRHAAVTILMSETKWDDKPRPWWRVAAVRRIAQLADSALVSGAAAGEYAITLGIPRDRVFRHYGAVDNALFATARENARSAAAADRPFFLACSRLVEQRKNVSSLLRAYRLYSDEAGPQAWPLVISGDGPDRERLVQLVAELDLSDVTFTGFLQCGELAALYARAGCFVHPAVNEAWGLVVNEAMAAGLPVLVSRRIGCAWDLLHEGKNGFGFEPLDVHGLAALLMRMGRLSSAERESMGSASQAIIGRYGLDAFASGLMAAIEAVDGLGSRVEAQPHA